MKTPESDMPKNPLKSSDSQLSSYGSSLSQRFFSSESTNIFSPYNQRSIFPDSLASRSSSQNNPAMISKEKICFEPSIIKEDQGKVAVHHLCAMNEYSKDCIEEIRYASYQIQGQTKSKFELFKNSDSYTEVKNPFFVGSVEEKNALNNEDKLFKTDSKPLHFSNSLFKSFKGENKNPIPKDIGSFKNYFLNLSEVEKKNSRSKNEKFIKLITDPNALNPIRLLLSVKPDISINDIKFLVSKELPDLKNFNLIYKSKILEQTETLSLLKIPDNGEITIIKLQNQQVNNQENDKLQLQKIPIDSFLPIIGDDYWTEPSIAEMEKMTVSQLMKIKNFTIVNDYEKLVFEGETNVVRLNLCEIVRVQDMSFVVYPDDIENEKPEVGFELNKPAVLTLFNFEIDKPVEEFEKVAIMAFEKENMEFLCYKEESKELVVRIKHF